MNDVEREQRIRELIHDLVCEDDAGHRRTIARNLSREINARSDEQVERMEEEKGLR